MVVPNILASLVNVSEKAANIARVFRQNEHLLELLVQEKTASDDANPRFVHDYKTLADVLIQETIRHDIGADVKSRKQKKNRISFDSYFSFLYIFIVSGFTAQYQR